jgi:hypothetical protein
MRQPFDVDAYANQVRDGPCFVCAMLAGERDYKHDVMAPLPPGVPYEQQQYHALMAECGVLAVTAEEQRRLASAIRRAL